MKGLRITNKENNKWMVQESPTIFYPQTIDDYYVDSVNILTDQELQERDERIARDYFIKGWNEACKWYVEIDKRDAAKEMREIDRLLKDYKKSKGEVRTGNVKKCGDTYIDDDYGSLKECSCNKIKEEKEILTADEVITQLKAMKWFEMGYDKGKKEERKHVIEQVSKFISDGSWTCSGSDYYQLKEFLTKLERGEE